LRQKQLGNLANRKLGVESIEVKTWQHFHCGAARVERRATPTPIAGLLLWTVWDHRAGR